MSCSAIQPRKHVLPTINKYIVRIIRLLARSDVNYRYIIQSIQTRDSFSQRSAVQHQAGIYFF